MKGKGLAVVYFLWGIFAGVALTLISGGIWSFIRLTCMAPS